MDPNYGHFMTNLCVNILQHGAKLLENSGVSSKTHCRFLHTINNSLPIDIALEKRCLKFLWSCINSKNYVVKSVSLSSLRNGYSICG